MQPKKLLVKGLLWVAITIVTYLSIAAIWALWSVEELLRKESIADATIYLKKDQIHILLAIEDPTFYDHVGIDISMGQGLTTISSSIARDIFLHRHKLSGIKGGMQSFYTSVFDCCKKIDLGRDIMAIVLNGHISKEMQLSYYVSNAYMGAHEGKAVYGIAEASETYYGKPVSNISLKEFMGLVAMVKAPNRYHPIKNPEEHKLRTDKVERIINGKCKPDGWFDTKYDHCAINA